MKYKLPLTLFLYFILYTSASQNLYNTDLKILIIDNSSGKGISNVNVRIKNSQKGASTSVNGYCEIKAVTFPVTLNISHIAYTDKEVVLNAPPPDKLIVYLQEETSLLDEVTVPYEIPATIIPREFLIIDFTICNSKLFVLGNYNNNHKQFKIIILDKYLDELALLKIPETISPCALYRDCLDNCHILSRDSAYQVIEIDTSWQICCDYEIDKFHAIMDNCQFQANNYIIFKQKNFGGYGQSFYGVHIKNNTILNFIENNDFKRLQELMYALQFIDPSKEYARRFEEEFMFKPFNDALLKFDDTLYHFNFSNGSIDFYSNESLQFIGKTTLDERITPSIWNDEILIDKTDNKAYLIFKKQLYEINTLTGKLTPKTQTKFAAKVLIDAGFLYYLTRTNNAFANPRTITRVKIN
ncbi:MAG: carboxypeptidase-like regulatory domain-containing protein [Bacteroidales bacterium]|nr:carboxypeptidase-like regulatory domain-containing protein [Bacteroidales bacterium]